MKGTNLAATAAATLQALIYRGPQSCGYDPKGDRYGCAESAANLLTTSSFNVNITYAGPNEQVQMDAATLANYDIFVQPGGGDLTPAWAELADYASAVNGFVSNGGLYIGICLGAYLAGPDSGYNLLPSGWSVGREVKQDGTQVSNTSDTVIQVDWKYSNGPQAGKTVDGNWIYFQDGAVMLPGTASSGQVLGKYTSNGDAAATLSSLGKGRVGLIGPHPEAPAEWYSDPDLYQPIVNPDGVKFDVGHDFVEAVMIAGKASRAGKMQPNTTSSATTTSSPSANAGSTVRGTGWTIATFALIVTGSAVV